MWYYLAICVYFARGGVADISSNYFCADLIPQLHVIIPQLMGMWYGVEIINHQEQRHYNRIVPSCPIIHISEDQPPTTINPLHHDYNYAYNYGEGHGYRTPSDQYGVSQQEMNQRNTYSSHSAPKKHFHDWSKQNVHLKRHNIPEIKYIRLYWDENGQATEFHLRYNVTSPGFWISSGPETEVPLDPQFGHYAGNVQIIKAVGNHLVLTFVTKYLKDNFIQYCCLEK